MLEGILAAILIILAIIVGGLAAFSRWTAMKVEKAVPPIGQFVEVDGAKLHYVARGEGPPVVMIHGLGGSLRHYTATILDEIAKTNRVIAIDRPGAGYSERPEGTDATLKTQAAIIQKALDRLGITDPLIVGHSLGGGVSLAHAVLHPDKARGYVLLAPVAQPPQAAPPMFKALEVRSPLMQFLIAWTVGVPLGIRYGKQITEAVFAPQRPTPDFPVASGGLLSLRPKAILTNMKDFMASTTTLHEICPRYGDVRTPVICLYGVSDNVLDAAFQLEPLKALPSGELQKIDGAGHMLMHVEPAAVIAAIRKLDAATGAAPRAAAAS